MNATLDGAAGMIDREPAILERIRIALERRDSLEIIGSGSKRFFGRRVQAQPLMVGDHRGILEYEPTELVMTARCGTTLREIETELARHGQMLPFEPPHFGPGATLGGAVAAGLSGPRRPYAGSVRDCVLGVKLVNGKAEVLSFGGRVMKNVAGFDLSRLMAGALGTLGLLLEVSLKVLPKPEHEWTLCFELAAKDALERMSRWLGEGLPLSASAHDGSVLRLRLAGSESNLRELRSQIGGDWDTNGDAFWMDLREQRLAFFEGPTPLWRMSVPPAMPIPALPGDWMLDWGGAQRWLRTEVAADRIFTCAAEQGGHAMGFRGDTDPAFQPLPPAMRQIQRRLKQAFDPAGVFNPGRLYEDW